MPFTPSRCHLLKWYNFGVTTKDGALSFSIASAYASPAAAPAGAAGAEQAALGGEPEVLFEGPHFLDVWRATQREELGGDEDFDELSAADALKSAKKDFGFTEKKVKDRLAVMEKEVKELDAAVQKGTAARGVRAGSGDRASCCSPPMK